MSAELIWFVGCPIVAAGVTAGALRLRRTTRPQGDVQPAGADDQTPLLLAVPPAPGEHPLARADGASAEALEAAAQVGAAGAADHVRKRRVGALLRRARGRVVTLVRGREVGSTSHRPDVLGALHADLVGERAADGRPDDGEEAAREDTADHAPWHATSSDGQGHLAPASATTQGLGIVEFLAEPTGPVAAGGAGWAAGVSAREQVLADTLAQRDAALLEQRQRDDAAASLRQQQELERIAVAEEARARAQARTRRWFARLDPDLDAPTVAQRSALVATLAIPAAWAGKLLREAYAQEQEPHVRARIVGALVAGDHLDVPEPFEAALAQGGVERAAVWEVLRPRQSEAAWIAPLLESVLDAATAA